MRLWQRSLIRLARSRRIKEFVQSRAALSGLAHRFVGGEDLGSALETCHRLRERGIRASLFYMGEYVADPDEIRRTVEAKEAAARALASAGLDVHLSVDPTQIGHLVSAETMRENAETVARAVRDAADGNAEPGVHMLMLDMEDETLVDPTLSLHRRLDALGLPVGLTLQAYLRRTRDDLVPLLDTPARVRLVKGAFAAGSEVAFTGPGAIRGSFCSIAREMLSDRAREAGFYPIFATHDDRLVDDIVEWADAADWPRERYEFEMLYGVRPELQEDLARGGLRVRAYVPFGGEWWPYAARRVGESPRNAVFLLRALGSLVIGGGRGSRSGPETAAPAPSPPHAEAR